MEYLLFFAILLFSIFRALTRAQKKAKEEAEQRRRLNEKRSPPAAPAGPKTLEDVMTEVFREVETRSKPFGDKRTLPPFAQGKKAERKAASRQLPPVSKKPPAAKKSPAPFLTTDYTAETIEPEGTPSASMEDFIKKSQLTDAYVLRKSEARVTKFNLREAVIAKIILDRPEW